MKVLALQSTPATSTISCPASGRSAHSLLRLPLGTGRTVGPLLRAAVTVDVCGHLPTITGAAVPGKHFPGVRGPAAGSVAVELVGRMSHQVALEAGQPQGVMEVGIDLRLSHLTTEPEVVQPQRSDPEAGRLQHPAESLRLLRSHPVVVHDGVLSVPTGPIYTAADISADPQYAARHMVQSFDVSTGEEILNDVGFPGIVPVIGEHSLPIHHLGPDLGEHTHEVLSGLLHLTGDQIAAATAAKENLPA